MQDSLRKRDSKMDYISVNTPIIGNLEMKYVSQTLKTGWISSSGPFLEKFESKWAKYCDRKYGIAVCNGTAALQTAIACLQLKPGDEIVMPTFTIVSCALAVLVNDCKPILVDCDRYTWTMDVNMIEEKITPKTKAIMVVHIYGHPADMDPILKLAKKYNLYVIEDAAEAHGAEYLEHRETSSSHWQRCGGFGDVSIFSFYANKPITTGEGGMIVTDDEKLANKARAFRNLCFLPERRFYHEELGFNFRLTNIQAAIGLAQLQRINSIIKKKKQIGKKYTYLLKDIDLIQLPAEKSWAKNIYWMYGIVLKKESGWNAKKVADRLYAKGIETRPFFLGMHKQPVFQKKGLFKNQSYPVADFLADQGLYLPSGLALTDAQIIYISKILHTLLS